MYDLIVTWVYAIVGMVAILLRRRLANLDEAPLGLRLAVGFGVGVLFCLPVIVDEVNIVPDAWEPAALAALLAGAVVGVLALAFQKRRLED